MRPQRRPGLENCFRHMIVLHIFGSWEVEGQYIVDSSVVTTQQGQAEEANLGSKSFSLLLN